MKQGITTDCKHQKVNEETLQTSLHTACDNFDDTDQ